MKHSTANRIRLQAYVEVPLPALGKNRAACYQGFQVPDSPGFSPALLAGIVEFLTGLGVSAELIPIIFAF